ncbi:transposase [Nocardia sp. NPDC024068]|uniref:transposase n=1 Tax=Nocardia sp. NPDC024068 TaxID=3157197 RepID=UPI0033DE3C0A
MDAMADWQNRPLDSVYPVLFLDCVNVKIRDGNVASRPIDMTMGVTVDGNRDIRPPSTAPVRPRARGPPVRRYPRGGQSPLHRRT